MMDDLETAIVQGDVDTIVALVAETVQCQRIVEYRIRDGTFPLQGPERWKVMTHLDLALYPEVVLDTIVEDFPTNSTDQDMVLIVLRTVAGLATWDPDYVTMVTRAVCTGVLRTLLSLDPPNRRILEDAFRIVREYRLWRMPWFRTHDGIRSLLAWVPGCYGAVLHHVLECVLSEYEEYVVHCDLYADAVISVIWFPRVVEHVQLVHVLFTRHIVPSLVSIARHTSETGFAAVMNKLRTMLAPCDFDVVASHWMERLDRWRTRWWTALRVRTSAPSR